MSYLSYMKSKVTLAFIVFIGIVTCIAPKPILWNIPINYPKSDLVTIRRFNAAIRTIDNAAVIIDRSDVALLSGKHTLSIQPEMWVSSFPSGKHLDEIKTVSFEAKPGEDVYVCLGLRDSSEWNPYVVIVHSGENPTQKLLIEMEKKAGCVSTYKTLPKFWTNP